MHYWLFYFCNYLYSQCNLYCLSVNDSIKTIPIACLISGSLQTNLMARMKVLLVMALGCSMIGDIILTLPISLVLELGIVFFLIAHCFYIAVFLKIIQYRASHLVYFLPVFFLMVYFPAYLNAKPWFFTGACTDLFLHFDVHGF